jgi:uncharacterized surface protein with fasciclin (FAS1) repeats
MAAARSGAKGSKIMKNLRNFTIAAAAIAALTLPVNAMAHCGSCGTGEAHAEHASDKSLQAIYPLAKEAGFNTLAAAVKAAGLEMTLTEKGPFTVFAPTDEAFAKLPEGTVESLLANPEQLKKVLLFHVVSGSVSSGEVVKLKSAMTLNGEKVMINTKDGVMINNAKVIKTDIAASNGTVHVIDTVLIPENL